MQRPPAWIGLVLLGLLYGSAHARLLARARTRPIREGGAASRALVSEPDVRRFSVRELRALPGVGETIARAVVETRARMDGAPFRWEEVPGIGPVRAQELGAWLAERGFAPEPRGEERGYAPGMRTLASGALGVLTALAAACGGERPAPAPLEQGPAVRARTLRLGDVELALREAGPAGPAAVVLLHGARYSSAEWVELGSLARLAGRGLRVLAIDWPGSGASPMAASEPEPGAFLGELLASESIERAVLVGPSRGGGQALALAARADPRVVGLVLIAPAGAQSFTPRADVPPTLLLWGADDDIVPLSVGQDLAARAPGARLEVFPGAGHACYLQQPERFHELLEGFLGELGLLAK
jgi:abhydrolase domain-containing protein 14